MSVKPRNYLFLLAALVLVPALSPAADKPAAKKPAKASVKAPAAEASEPASASKPVVTHVSAAIAALKADPETGREINGVCAACHGDTGQGGKRGEYPRLAGQHVEYLMDQLKKFKERKRTNLPMFPYTEERELPDEDIVHVSAYLSSIKLDTTYPVFKDTDGALFRLTAMDKVLNIPRSEGDVEAGAKLYKAECTSCHKKDGMGHKTVPMLAGQYTLYLKRQIDKFVKGERIHDEDLKDASKDVLNLLKPDEIRDILAFLTTLDD